MAALILVLAPLLVAPDQILRLTPRADAVGQIAIDLPDVFVVDLAEVRLH